MGALAVSAMAISWIVFACVFGGALLGILLRGLLPEHYLDADSRNVVNLGMALIATLSALVLGLLIASAKGSYDAQRGEVISMSADIILLDRILARYGRKPAKPVMSCVEQPSYWIGVGPRGTSSFSKVGFSGGEIRRHELLRKDSGTCTTQ